MYGRSSARWDSRSSARRRRSSVGSCAQNSNTGTGSCANSRSNSIERRRPAHLRLITQRRAYHHHADPPGDFLVLDDEDLAALAVRAAAGGVVAAPGAGAGRVHAERPAFLHRGDVPQSLERGSDVGNDLVHAGYEEEPARAEGVSGDAVAAAVGVDDLAGFGDGVDAADEIVGDRRAAAHANALVGIAHRLHLRAQPVVRPVLERVEKPDLLERRRAAVHHRHARRDAREQKGEGGRAVRAIREVDAAPPELALQAGHRLGHALVPDRRLDGRVHHSPSFTARPPRKRFEKSLSHLSPSSSASSGSTISYLNLLSGLSTSLLVGTRFPLFRISWPSFESTNSAKRSAACGCGA